MIANIGTTSLAVALVILKVLWRVAVVTLKVLWGAVKWTGKLSARHPRLSGWTIGSMFMVVGMTQLLGTMGLGWWLFLTIAGVCIGGVVLFIITSDVPYDRNKHEGDVYLLVRLRRRR